MGYILSEADGFNDAVWHAETRRESVVLHSVKPGVMFTYSAAGDSDKGSVEISYDALQSLINTLQFVQLRTAGYPKPPVID